MSIFSGMTLPILGVIVAGCLGLYTYHQAVVTTQRTKIETLEKANNQLKADVATAVSANNSMQKQVDALAIQSAQMLDILQTVQTKDKEIATWFEDARNTINSTTSRQDLAKKLKENPSDVINDANSEIDCTLQNLGKLGICKSGVFVPLSQGRPQ